MEAQKSLLPDDWPARELEQFISNARRCAIPDALIARALGNAADQLRAELEAQQKEVALTAGGR